jgi:endo-1,3(4)-beta-glucanase
VNLRPYSLWLSLALVLLSGCSVASTCTGNSLSCGGVCVDATSDNLHCGSCSNICPVGTVCTSGACAVPCAVGLLACGNACVDPQTDETYCGASGTCSGTQAGTACAAAQTCQGGTCACPISGQVACGGSCIDPRTSPTYCGASGTCSGTQAGIACAAGLTCQGGSCACPVSGQVACGGACIDPQTSVTYCGASGTCSGASAGNACAPGQFCQSGSCVADCRPVALDLDTPFSTDPAPFASSTNPVAPTAFWGSIAAPRPTNTSWQNIVLGTGQGRLNFLPYQIVAEPVFLDVGTASAVSFSGSVDVPIKRQVMLGAGEFDNSTSRVVQSYDLFSVTLRYSVASGTMTAPLVYGMPYVTVDYANLQPKVLPGPNTITSVNGSSTTGNVTGTRFELALSDGTTWVVYSTASLTFSWIPGQMIASSKFSGTLRVANVPTTGAAAVLDAHAATVPTGGSLEVSVACDVATVRFVYATRGGTGPLLLTAMPHHLARLVSPVTTSLTYPSLSGTLQAVEGSTWTMSLPLSTIGFAAPRPIAPAHIDAVRNALAGDAGFVPDSTLATDTYFYGKQLAKLARLALIADELGDPTTAATLRNRLAPLLAATLDGTNGNPFVYDTTWGGAVTTLAIANPSIQFGQGRYNDHHFHYGYILYAAAALARADPAFEIAHRQQLLALVRDIANPSVADTRFPRFRHMDLFRGHSWARGLDEAIPQNQESTSEAVNAWYALHLLGLARSDSRMSDLGRVLLALEVDGARTYWQIPGASAIYEVPFKQNMCVGRLFEAQATFDTFFGGTGPQYVYGIQMLPFTPASEPLLSPTWIADAWPKMQAAASGATQGWQGLLYMGHAAADPAAAWLQVNTLTGYDDGNSQTNTLWWVATRP